MGILKTYKHRSLFKYNPTWGYWFRENLYARVPSLEPDKASYVVETNALGARTHHLPSQESSRDKLQILFIGCSYTAGDGVSNTQRFTDLLETQLSHVVCHNYALSGSGNDQQYLIHREFALQIQPDILIVSPYVGCIERNITDTRRRYDPLSQGNVETPKPRFSLSENGLKIPNIAVPKTRLFYENQQKQSAPATGRKKSVRSIIPQSLRIWRRSLRDAYRKHKSSRLPHPHYNNTSNEAYRLTQQILIDLFEESTATHKFLMPLPGHQYLHHASPTHYLKFYEQVANQTQATLLNVLEKLTPLPKSQREQVFFQYDPHFSAFGHAQVAHYLADQLPTPNFQTQPAPRSRVTSLKDEVV